MTSNISMVWPNWASSPGLNVLVMRFLAGQTFTRPPEDISGGRAPPLLANFWPVSQNATTNATWGLTDPFFFNRFGPACATLQLPFLQWSCAPRPPLAQPETLVPHFNTALDSSKLC